MAAARPRARPPATHTGGEREAQTVRRPPPARPTEHQSTSNQRAGQPASQPVLSLGPVQLVSPFPFSQYRRLVFAPRARERSVGPFVCLGWPRGGANARAQPRAGPPRPGRRAFVFRFRVHFLAVHFSRAPPRFWQSQSFAVGGRAKAPPPFGVRHQSVIRDKNQIQFRGRAAGALAHVPHGPASQQGCGHFAHPNAHGRACARTQAI